MRRTTRFIIDDLFARHPALESCAVVDAVEVLIGCYRDGGKLLICGNGGSAADSLHVVGELMKGFKLERKLSEELQMRIGRLAPKNAEYLISNLQSGFPAISLVSELALCTAFSNDRAADLVFAQQVLVHGSSKDVLLAISTSGNSKNIIHAAEIAKVQGMVVISLTGKIGGQIKHLSDVTIAVPSTDTSVIQELHLPVYHAICACIENEFFGQ